MKNTLSPFTIVIIFFLLSLLGIFVVPHLSIQLLPSPTSSSASITCNLPNASSEIMDAKISSLIERGLSTIDGVENISSYSSNGFTNLRFQMRGGKATDHILLEVTSLIRRLYHKLPPDASYPILNLDHSDSAQNQSDPSISYTLIGANDDEAAINKIEKRIRTTFAAVDGIRQIVFEGAKRKQLIIIPDETKMSSLGISYVQLQEDLKSLFSSKELGTADFKEHIALTYKASVSSLEQFRNLSLATNAGRNVKISDFMTIRTERVMQNRLFRINGSDVISIKFFFETEVNTLDIARIVHEKMFLVSKQIPVSHKLAIQYDRTDQLKNELHLIYFRNGLSLLILMVFTWMISRNKNAIIIIICALFVNVLVCLLIYKVLNLELHVFSLAGLTISLGMVVDNTIVVLEEIKNTGKNRVFWAILASTAASIGALCVIFFMNEAEKKDLLDFNYAIIINLIVSLPISYFFVPAYLALINQKESEKRVGIEFLRKVAKINSLLEKFIIHILRRKKAVILLIILGFGLPLFLLPESMDDSNLLGKCYNYVFGGDTYNRVFRKPVNQIFGGALYLYVNNMARPIDSGDGDKTQLFVEINMPEGSDINHLDLVCRDFETYLSKFSNQVDLFKVQADDPNFGRINIKFKPNYENVFPYELKDFMEKIAIKAGVADFNIYGVGKGFENSIGVERYDSTIQLRGYNFETLESFAFAIQDTLTKNPRVNKILISVADRGNAEDFYSYRATVKNLHYFQLQGIPVQSFLNALSEMADDNAVVGNMLLENDRDMPVLLRKRSDAINQWQFSNYPVKVGIQQTIPLTSAIDVKKIKTGKNILRENQMYRLNVHFQFIGSYELNELCKKILIGSFIKKMPFGYKIFDSTYKGSWIFKQSLKILFYIFLVLITIYLICGILLESFIKPMIVLSVIPFSFIGVFFVFYLFDINFNQGAYASLFLLAGLVANSVLYIINDINYYERFYHKRSKAKIYIKAVNAKILPISITTTSAIVSMLPFMFSADGKGFWMALSIGSIAGLLFSMLSIFIILPLALDQLVKK